MVSKAKHKNFIINLLFTFSALVYLIAIESDAFILTDFSFPPSQTEIELALTDFQTPNFNSPIFNQFIKCKTIVHSEKKDFPKKNTFALLYFNRSIIHQIKFCNKLLITVHSPIPFIQRSIVEHKSSDDDSFQLS